MYEHVQIGEQPQESEAQRWYHSPGGGGGGSGMHYAVAVGENRARHTDIYMSLDLVNASQRTMYLIKSRPTCAFY